MSGDHLCFNELQLTVIFTIVEQLMSELSFIVSPRCIFFYYACIFCIRAGNLRSGLGLAGFIER